jgi:signal transduction histidine kinase
MLQAANLSEDALAGMIIAAHGRTDFVNAIEEFESGQLDARFLELLCCNGCIMGAGMSQQAPMFTRRAQIAQYVRQRQATFDAAAWQKLVDQLAGLDLSRQYLANDQRVPPPSREELNRILAKLGKSKPEDELNCGACGYDTCMEHATAIFKGLAESEMCLPYTIEKLHDTIKELASSKVQLEDTREALVHSEKLASMGQLAAGVAHEINNPLGVVLMYAHLLLEQSDERSQFYKDLAMVAGQADRCKKIVSQLLNFARQNKALYQSANLRSLVTHSMQSMPPPDNVVVSVEHDGDSQCEVDPDQIVQVLTNLMDNAYSAMPNGGELKIRTHGDGAKVALTVSDTGVGIAAEHLGRIFEPFFTTKQIGMGTGLGLSVTYGIVKLHRGDIAVKSNADPAAGPTGTTFTVTLPRRPAAEEERSGEGVIGAEPAGASAEMVI